MAYQKRDVNNKPVIEGWFIRHDSGNKAKLDTTAKVTWAPPKTKEEPVVEVEPVVEIETTATEILIPIEELIAAEEGEEVVAPIRAYIPPMVGYADDKVVGLRGSFIGGHGDMTIEHRIQRRDIDSTKDWVSCIPYTTELLSEYTMTKTDEGKEHRVICRAICNITGEREYGYSETIHPVINTEE